MTLPNAPEFKGPDSVVDAMGTFLDYPDIDMVLVSGLLTAKTLRQLTPDDHVRQDVLYDAVPQLEEADKLSLEWWQNNGYCDYALEPSRMMAGGYRQGGIGVHMDSGTTGSSLYGPVTLSIATSRTPGLFFAERIQQRPVTDEGRFDRSSYDALRAKTKQERKLESGSERPLRSFVRQGRGDAALIMNHPYPTWHAVQASSKRHAHLFERFIKPR